MAIRIWVTEKVAAVVGEPAGRLLCLTVVTAGESGQKGREPGGSHKHQGQRDGGVEAVQADQTVGHGHHSDHVDRPPQLGSMWSEG